MIDIEQSALQEEVEQELLKLGKDYDLTDMNSNDLTVLRNMAILMVRLTRSEEILEERIREEAIASTEAQREEQRLSTMRSDILKLQDSLGIGRSKRKSSTEQDPRVLFQDIRQRALEFLNERLCWVYCPECKMMICSVNFLYPENNNTLHFECGRCKHTFKITSRELLEVERKNPYK